MHGRIFKRPRTKHIINPSEKENTRLKTI